MLSVLLVLATWPALSVMVSLTVTEPEASATSVAVGWSAAPLKWAVLAPAVISHR